METREIITDVALLQDRAEEVDFKDKDNLKGLKLIIKEMKQVMRDNNLLSLSANQLGYDARVFLLNFSGDIREFVNPVLVNCSGMSMNLETCSCLPGKKFVIPRYEYIQAIFLTANGKQQQCSFYGIASYKFQHALDHLEGVLLPDIGMEVDDNYESLSEEEKLGVVKNYCATVEDRQKKVDEEIESDPLLSQIKEGMRFEEAVKEGKVEVKPLTDDEIVAIKERELKAFEKAHAGEDVECPSDDEKGTFNELSGGEGAIV